jgi:microcystin-dependent protein
MTTTNRQRVVVGAGQGSGLTSRAVNDTGGAASVALVTAELPSHNHTITSGANVLRIVVSGGTRLNNAGTTYAQGDASINNAGTGDYHENRQPCLMMYAIIRT